MLGNVVGRGGKRMAVNGNIAKPLGLGKDPNPVFHVVKRQGFSKTGFFTGTGPKPRDVPSLVHGTVHGHRSWTPFMNTVHGRRSWTPFMNTVHDHRS